MNDNFCISQQLCGCSACNQPFLLESLQFVHIKKSCCYYHDSWGCTCTISIFVIQLIINDIGKLSSTLEYGARLTSKILLKGKQLIKLKIHLFDQRSKKLHLLEICFYFHCFLFCFLLNFLFYIHFIIAIYRSIYLSKLILHNSYYHEEIDSRSWVEILDMAAGISLCINTLEKVIIPSLLSPAMEYTGLLSFSKTTCLKKENSEFKPWGLLFGRIYSNLVHHSFFSVLHKFSPQ